MTRYPVYDPNFSSLDRFSFTTDITGIEALNIYREHCQQIQDNYDDFPSRDLCHLLMFNSILLSQQSR